MYDGIALVSQFQSLSLKDFYLRHGTCLVGRSEACQLLINDATVSRRHAEITISAAEMAVTDLGSHNGTYLNGQPIRTARIVAGDQIQFGRVRFLLALTGAMCVNSELDGSTASCASEDNPAFDLPRLSPAQLRVFDLLAKGWAEKQIG